MKIGAITIGQAPRTDVTADILHIFDDSLELVQAGGLDGLTKEQIAEFAPGKDDYVLVSRLTDGSSVTFAERHILPRLQDAINRMEDEGCSLIMMFCTGSFPETLSTRKIPMIYPCELLNRLVPLMTKKSDIICMTPSPLQTEPVSYTHLDVYKRQPFIQWPVMAEWSLHRFSCTSSWQQEVSLEAESAT